MPARSYVRVGCNQNRTGALSVSLGLSPCLPCPVRLSAAAYISLRPSNRLRRIWSQFPKGDVGTRKVSTGWAMDHPSHNTCQPLVLLLMARSSTVASLGKAKGTRPKGVGYKDRAGASLFAPVCCRHGQTRRDMGRNGVACLLM